MSEMKSRQLIVNADDLGLSEGINRGIIDCYQNGIVTSATIIPTGVAYEHALKLVRQNARLDVGVHLTLIAEEPVLQRDAVTSLIDSDGCFFDSHFKFIYRYFTGRIDLREVQAELEAQIKKVSDAGIEITHLDSHRHLHMLPAMLDITLALAKKFKINGIRVPEGNVFRLYSPKEIGLRLLRWRSKGKLSRSGLRFPGHFWGLAEGGRITERDLLALLDDLKTGVTELMCHPGYLDEVYLERYASWGYEPEVELAALTSAKVKAKLTDNKINLVNFKDSFSRKEQVER
jgi:hopanoid biosynthesis associated protein HpnK